jgi:hypothetical protein
MEESHLVSSASSDPTGSTTRGIDSYCSIAFSHRDATQGRECSFHDVQEQDSRSGHAIESQPFRNQWNLPVGNASSKNSIKEPLDHQSAHLFDSLLQWADPLRYLNRQILSLSKSPGSPRKCALPFMVISDMPRLLPFLQSAFSRIMDYHDTSVSMQKTRVSLLKSNSDFGMFLPGVNGPSA